MNDFFMSGAKGREGGGKWRKMKNRDTAGTEALLRAVESNYVSACGRYLARNNSKDHVWKLTGEKGELHALIVHSKSTMIPVLCGKTEIPRLHFLGGFLRKVNLHSVQGLRSEVIVMESELARMGRKPQDIIDYDLMYIDKKPNASCYSSGPVNLVLRKPKLTDLDEMAVLQAAYEQEEVLSKGSVFSPAASRINTANIIANSSVLAAELGGRLVGKINISSVSFTRYMIGGVFVHPDFRGMGIACRMAAEFTDSLVSNGMGVTLFVKKSNLAARRLYASLGYSAQGDYRISYY